jgi:hypothetical protein
MSRQQLPLFCSAPRDRAAIQVISVKTFKTAAILFIDSVTDDCRYFPISGQFIPDTRNHQQGKMHKMSIKQFINLSIALMTIESNASPFKRNIPQEVFCIKHHFPCYSYSTVQFGFQE